MKYADGGFRANEIEGLLADTGDPFVSKKLYVIEGEPGIYRRLSGVAAKAYTGGEVREVYHIGGTIYVTRVPAIEAELSLAGYECAVKPRPQTQTEPPADKNGHESGGLFGEGKEGGAGDDGPGLEGFEVRAAGSSGI